MNREPQLVPANTAASPGSARTGRWLAVSAELVLAIALVFLGFGIFMTILWWSFPGGTRLSDLVAQHAAARKASNGGVTPRGAALLGEQGQEAFIALVSSIRRVAKTKEANSVAWSPAARGHELNDQDAVQTFTRSSATLDFGPISELQVEENSMIVLSRPENLAFSGPRRTSVIAMQGQVRGRIGASEPGRPGFELKTRSGASLTPVAGKGDADVRVVVDAAGGATFMVYSGTAEVQSPAGPIQLTANQAVAADASGVLADPVTIPSPPRLLAPADGAVIPVRRSGPGLRLQWSTVQGATAYRVVVARDAEFADIAFDDQVATPEASVPSMIPGACYWRVTTVAGPLESAFSETRALKVAAGAGAPGLTVRFPQTVVTERTVAIHGRTDRGVSIFMGEDRVPVRSDGSFHHIVRLEPGINLIVVQAIDTAGNVAYASQHVTARY